MLFYRYVDLKAEKEFSAETIIICEKKLSFPLHRQRAIQLPCINVSKLKSGDQIQAAIGNNYYFHTNFIFVSDTMKTGNHIPDYLKENARLFQNIWVELHDETQIYVDNNYLVYVS